MAHGAAAAHHLAAKRGDHGLPRHAPTAPEPRQDLEIAALYGAEARPAKTGIPIALKKATANGGRHCRQRGDRNNDVPRAQGFDSWARGTFFFDWSDE
jgi:hypothetical protein